jgi:hypothetical protein
MPQGSNRCLKEDPNMTINELVRKQILAEGPDLPSERNWKNQTDYNVRCETYIDEQLNAMNNVELLERISAAMEP